MSALENIREIVRQRYADAATRSAAGDHETARAVETACCGGAPVATTDEHGGVVFGADLYKPEAALGSPATALAASLGCGVPTAVADLHPGEVVLDLGSGAGADVLISARRVAPGGKAIGLDMTPEMLELARRNAADAGVDNVEFLQGYLEDIPLPDDSVDVVISNCVINLAADKSVVLAEAARVLRPGGRLAFADVLADDDMDEPTKADMAEWTGCIAGALTQAEFTDALTAAGFTQIQIRLTHRVHARAQAAIIRASTDRSEPHPIDGKVRFSGIRPSLADLAAPLGPKVPAVGTDLLAPTENACCTPTEQAATGCCGSAEQAGAACCTPTEQAATGCCGSAEQVREPQVASSGCC